MLDLSDSRSYRGVLRDGQLIGARSILTRQATMKFGPPPRKIEARTFEEPEMSFYYKMADRLPDATSWDELVAGL